MEAGFTRRINARIIKQTIIAAKPGLHNAVNGYWMMELGVSLFYINLKILVIALKHAR